MSKLEAAMRGADAARRNGNAAAMGAADFLYLAAAPTFAVMALLTGCPWRRVAGCIVLDGGASQLGGMVPMYLLMSAFHLAPWLKLVAGRRAAPAGPDPAFEMRDWRRCFFQHLTERNNMSKAFTGGCACGAIHYEISAEPIFMNRLPVPRLPAQERHRARIVPDLPEPQGREADRPGHPLGHGRRQRQCEDARFLPDLRRRRSI